MQTQSNNMTETQSNNMTEAVDTDIYNKINKIKKRALEITEGRISKGFKSLQKEEKIKLIKTLKDEGYSTYDISSALGISQATVHYFLRQSSEKDSDDNESDSIVDESMNIDETDAYDISNDEETIEERYSGTLEEILPEKIKYQGDIYTPREIVITYGKRGLDILKTIALKRSFEILPIPKGKKFTDKTKNWIIRKFITSEIYRDNPNELSRLIKEYTGLEQHIINDIIEIIWQVDREYRPLIREFIYLSKLPPVEDYEYYTLDHPDDRTYSAPTPTQTTPNTTYIPKNRIYPQPLHQTSYLPNNPTVISKEDILKIIKEYEEEKKKITLEDRIKQLEENLAVTLNAVKTIIDKIKEDSTNKDSAIYKEHTNTDQIQLISQQLSEIQNKILTIENQLLSQKAKTEYDPFDAFEKIEKAYEKITGLLNKQIEPIASKLYELEKKVAIPANNIDDKVLRLKELEIEKEIKSIDSQNRREAIRELSKSIEQAISKLGREIGRGIASKKSIEEESTTGYTQAVVVGNEIHAICPQCGVQVKSPTNVTEVKCPQCNSIIAIVKQAKATNETKDSNEKLIEQAQV